MNAHDEKRLNRALVNLFSNVKDVTSANLVSALKLGHIEMKESVMMTLLAVMASSMDEAFYKGQKTFVKVVDELIEVASDVGTSSSAKKKK